MSDPELVSYKKQQIDKLRLTFNTNVSKLQKRYNQNIKNINSLSLSRLAKRYYIQYSVNKYNENLKTMQNKLKRDVNLINQLINIPGRIQLVTTEVRRSDKFALIVGINYENTINELSGCINDANNMNKFLNGYAYKNENIVLLTDETDLKPTKRNIISEFTNLLQKSINGDTLVFYYSGHGTNTYDLNGDEIDGIDELIVPIDTTSIESCILDDELKTIIYNNLKQGVKLFVLMDCCFSGTICDLKYNYIDKDNFDNTTINPKSSETLGQVVVISGCSDKQTSSEATITDGVTNSTCGAMSFAFLNTITEKGDKISINELLESMRTLLSDNMYEQTVQMSSGCQIDISNTLLTDIF